LAVVRTGVVESKDTLNQSQQRGLFRWHITYVRAGYDGHSLRAPAYTHTHSGPSG